MNLKGAEKRRRRTGLSPFSQKERKRVKKGGKELNFFLRIRSPFFCFLVCRGEKTQLGPTLETYHSSLFFSLLCSIQSSSPPPPLFLIWQQLSHVHGWKHSKSASFAEGEIMNPSNSMIYNNGRTCHLSSSLSAHDLRCFEVEKEKENISSPRGVLEACIKGSDSEIDDSPSEREVCDRSSSQAPRHAGRWGGILKLWRKGAMKRLSSIPAMAAVPKLSRGKSRREPPETEAVDTDCCLLKCSWKTFSLSELQDATNDFDQENMIGKGGYADVYQGCLPDGQLVAVKRLSKGTTEEQTIGLLSEIGTIAHVNHPNTAKLIGYCAEGGKYLVLRLSPLGSLGSLLRGSKEKLNWAVRFKIIKGTAAGLYYLHEHCQRRIIHRDIKADNILLTEDFEPQICDFGLAMWLPREWTHHNVPKFEGTFGYFAPEYMMHGTVDEKTDVFSFGVLLLELITGREALDDEKKSLVLWAKPFLDNKEVEKLVDSCLGGIYDPEEMDRAITLASLCIDQSPVIRPQMGQVLAMLRGEKCELECGAANKRQVFQRTYSQELMDAEEYNSTRYLRDINQHKQLVLGS